MTYLWSPAIQIQMTLSNRQPQQFLWSSHLHRVQQIAMYWRVDMEWWRLRIWRDYYKVTTDTQLLVVVYCDLTDNRWYIQQLYD